MIRINLLPTEMRGRERRERAPRASERPSVIAIVLALLILAVDAYAAYSVFSKVYLASSETKRRETELAKVKQDRDAKLADFTEYRALREKLENQVAILKNLDPPDRILWSEKLNLLARLIGPNAFVTQLQVGESVKDVETPQSQANRKDWAAKGKQGKEPGKVMVPVITQTLNITGVSTGENERECMSNAVQFGTDLQTFQTQNPRAETVGFMDGFRPPQPKRFVIIRLGGKQVCRFEYRLQTLPMSGSPM